MCMYVCMHLCMHVYACVYASVHACVCMCVYIYACMCTMANGHSVGRGQRPRGEALLGWSSNCKYFHISKALISAELQFNYLCWTAGPDNIEIPNAWLSFNPNCICAVSSGRSGSYCGSWWREVHFRLVTLRIKTFRTSFSRGRSCYLSQITAQIMCECISNNGYGRHSPLSLA